MKKLFLVDVSSLFFRAFYAVRPLSSPSGMPTNAIYGFLSMVMKLLKDEKPQYLVFCYDRKDPSFRKDLYEDYKANRTEMPEDLIPQIPYIKKVADILGIPSLEVPKYEADDLIGSLTKWGLKNKMEVDIVSGDKDFAQLVADGVYLVDTMKNTKIGVAGVQEKWGVKPEQFIDYLALVGDSSDNIPGVKGIGPKGACKLLEDYNDLDGIYKNIDQIKGATKDKLIASKENAYLSQKLSAIVCDIPLSADPQTYCRKPFDRKAVTEFLNELNFKTLEKNIWALDLDSESGPSEANEEIAEVAPLKPSQPPENLSPVFEVDISELKQLLKPQLEVWAFSSDMGFFIAMDGRVCKLSGELKDLGPLADEYQIHWKGHDLKNLWHQIQVKNPIGSWDSMLAHYIVKPGESSKFEDLYLQMTGESIPELPSGAQVFEAHLKLEQVLLENLRQVHGEKIFNDYDLPMAAVLYKMEKRGILLDREFLAQQSQELATDLTRLEKSIHELAGETFNIASPKQLAVILFEKLKLPPGKKTKTGYSTDVDVLEKLKSEHKLPEFILEYRELAKLKSTYVDALPQLVKEDHRIHTHYNQADTATGRLSSTDPNLQNIPIRTKRGAQIRKAFVADKGKVLLSIDYSQIELRVLAHYSDDPGLTKAFMEDLDIHTATAAEVFAVPLKEVTSEQRRAAKAVNFGIAYGQGAFGLSENLGISRSEAADIIKRYFGKFPGVQNYIEDTIASAKDKGFVETLLGRKRYMVELKSANVNIQKFGERAAINAPIQGTAADIVKMAMIEIDQKFSVPMLLQVHDELIFEDSIEQIEKYRPQLIKVMEGIVKLKVPLKANSAVGKNWGEAK
jgi:DNA polymerase I